MKRSLIMAGCSGLLAFAVLADPVTSINRVGYNKMDMERGKIYLIASAFEDIDGGVLKATDVIGEQLPGGTKIYSYDGTPYTIDQRSGLSGNWTANIDFHGFMGFWVQVPNGPDPQSFSVVLKGQVPDASSISNLVVNGLNMLGYPYTADVAFSNTALYAASSGGDKLYVYNQATQAYLLPPYQKSGLSGSWGAAETLVLEQGQGFWYVSTGADIPVQEPRPYPVD